MRDILRDLPDADEVQANKRQFVGNMIPKLYPLPSDDYPDELHVRDLIGYSSQKFNDPMVSPNAHRRQEADWMDALFKDGLDQKEERYVMSILLKLAYPWDLNGKRVSVDPTIGEIKSIVSGDSAQLLKIRGIEEEDLSIIQALFVTPSLDYISK